MASAQVGPVRKVWITLASVQTGIVLLIAVVIAAAMGTVVMQRPMNGPEKMQAAYDAETLRFLDALSLTDVYHAWWFTLLMALLGLSVICTSIARFPQSWRYFRRPYRWPEPHFRAGVPARREIEIDNQSDALAAASAALRRHGFRPQTVTNEGEPGLYAERHRWSRLAAYVVHVSLLLILAGGIIDSVWGFRGSVALERGEEVSGIVLNGGEVKPLPFSLRCEGAGQENYANGSPKRWWSHLVVLEAGQPVVKKTIEVNDPLVYRGLRFFQANYGPGPRADSVQLRVMTAGAPPQNLTLLADEPVTLGSARIRQLEFVPDFYLQDNVIYTRSPKPVNPAVQIEVSTPAGKQPIWVLAGYPPGTSAVEGMSFEVLGGKTGYMTGLAVAYEPGQWGVWAGSVLMAIGLAMAFYFVHERIWIVPVRHADGRLTLWLGNSASKNRELVEERFGHLVAEIENTLAARRGAAAAD